MSWEAIVVKVVVNAVLAVCMAIVFFVTRWAMTPQFALNHRFYISHGSGVWYQLVCAAGFLIFGGEAVWSYVKLSRAAPAPIVRQNSDAERNSGTGVGPVAPGSATSPAAPAAASMPGEPGANAGETTVKTDGRQTEDW